MIPGPDGHDEDGEVVDLITYLRTTGGWQLITITHGRRVHDRPTR